MLYEDIHLSLITITALAGAFLPFFFGQNFYIIRLSETAHSIEFLESSKLEPQTEQKYLVFNKIKKGVRIGPFLIFF